MQRLLTAVRAVAAPHTLPLGQIRSASRYGCVRPAGSFLCESRQTGRNPRTEVYRLRKARITCAETLRKQPFVSAACGRLATADDGGVLMLRNPNSEPSCPENLPENGWGEQAVPDGLGSPSLTGATGSEPTRNVYSGRRMLKGAAARAGSDADRGNAYARSTGSAAQSRRSSEKDIEAILAEVAAKRSGQTREMPGNTRSYAESSVSADRHPSVDRGAERPHQRKPAQSDTGTARRRADGKRPAAQGGKRKKKKNPNSVGEVLKSYFIPWSGDSVSEAMRKIVFTSALCVVGACTFLISNYYIDLYQAKKAYQAMQADYEEARKRRGFQDDGVTNEAQVGGVIEYLDYNYVADRFLSQNPDLVGYICIPNTLVSYPVVQKKSLDPNINTNDYYLYRTFHQESSKSGCIFMDFRCHFDEVVDHRRVVENSGNLLIYGHNMNNQTMFGSLRNYVNNPGYYMEHPIVELDSIYNSYKYKIFAVFIVDGDDYTSKYAFNVWNTLEFEGEDEFYDFVNNAKKRTMINTSVDVKYGDPLLTLYTCHGLVKNAKLLLLCRQVRAGEDPMEGTQDATLNDNVMYPQAYYDYGHPEDFDPSKFVPYGPEKAE